MNNKYKALYLLAKEMHETFDCLGHTGMVRIATRLWAEHYTKKLAKFNPEPKRRRKP